MTKKILFLILVLTGIASAQYNSVLNIQVRSGSAIPGSCAPDGSFFFKSTTTKDWYKCIAGSWVAFGSVSGTVTSVGLSATGSTWYTITGSPVTSAGTLALGLTSGLTGNQVIATPDGTTGTVSLRALAAGDIPNLSAAKITSGTFTLAGALFANNGTTTTLLHGNGAGNPAFGQVVNGDIANNTIDLTAKVTGILNSANGGTASGFFTVAGPASTVKTFTFPNASANVLTDNAAVTAAQGGSGVASPTAHGVLLAEGASAFTPLVCGADTVLHGLAAADPNCAALTNATGGAAAVTYDTSAHTFGALTNILTGSLTSTRVPFSSGANALTDSANLVYAAASGFTQIQGANAADAFTMKRATDTTPTGNFLRFRNAAASTDLFTVDVAGNVTAASYSATNASGNAGMLSLIQGTAPSNVANAVNLLAPASVTTYALTYPSVIAAGIWRTNSSGVYSIAELSGDATTSTSNAVTVVKVNGVSYAASPSTTTIPEITASNTATYRAIGDCGDSTHALSHTAVSGWACQAITGSAAAGGSNTQVQFNSATALAGSANLTWVSPTLTVGLGGSATGIVAFGGATSGTTSVTGPATGSGTNTLQAVTDTFVYRASTDTLTNKTYDSQGTGNVFKINGTTVTTLVPLSVGGTNANITASNGGIVYSTASALAVLSAGTAGQMVRSGGAGAPTFIDFPSTFYIPFASCVNGTAASGLSSASTPAALCRAGTNNKDALLSPWGASDVGYFKIHLPNDWDSGASLDLSIDLTSTDATNGHTIIMQAATVCAKGDGSTTDDVAFNTAQSLGTITLNGNANRTWNATLTGLTKTGCIAGSTLWVKLSRTSDTATNVGVYGATLDVPRLLTVQAN